MAERKCLKFREYVLVKLLDELRVVTQENAHRLIDELQGRFPDCSALEALTGFLRVCPVPFTEDPDANAFYSSEQAWETYGTPPVPGGQWNQPPEFMEACSVIRTARNKYRAKQMEPFLKKKGEK